MGEWGGVVRDMSGTNRGQVLTRRERNEEDEGEQASSKQRDL